MATAGFHGLNRLTFLQRSSRSHQNGLHLPTGKWIPLAFHLSPEPGLACKPMLCSISGNADVLLRFRMRDFLSVLS
jgi:hypothetical protein